MDGRVERPGRQGSTQSRKGGSRVGVAQVVSLTSVAALQEILHEVTRSDTKTSSAAVRGLKDPEVICRRATPLVGRGTACRDFPLLRFACARLDG